LLVRGSNHLGMGLPAEARAGLRARSEHHRSAPLQLRRLRRSALLLRRARRGVRVRAGARDDAFVLRPLRAPGVDRARNDLVRGDGRRRMLLWHGERL